MVQTSAQVERFGQSLPVAPVVDEVDGEDRNDLEAALWLTPRPAAPVARLARRILTATTFTKHWIVWASLSVALWAVGTAVANGIGRGALLLGFGGFGIGAIAGLVWIAGRYREALAIAREGQMLTGVTTYRRSRETFGGELSETFDALLGERRHSVVFSIGFIRHELRVAFDEARYEGEPCSVLVRPGARYALAFDAHGRAHVGELLRIR